MKTVIAYRTADGQLHPSFIVAQAHVNAQYMQALAATADRIATAPTEQERRAILHMALCTDAQSLRMLHDDALRPFNTVRTSP